MEKSQPIQVKPSETLEGIGQVKSFKRTDTNGVTKVIRVVTMAIGFARRDGTAGI